MKGSAPKYTVHVDISPSVARPISIPYRKAYLLESPFMSMNIVICVLPQEFVIAADGRRRKLGGRKFSDEIQKIFQIQRTCDTAFAFAIGGMTAKNRELVPEEVAAAIGQ
jgi:hypothetical protein